jgi:hypothetical protein
MLSMPGGFVVVAVTGEIDHRPGGLVSEGTILECARIFLMEGRPSSLSSESEISPLSKKVDAF